MDNKQVANTILQQLGGNKFIVMTGAKNFVCGDGYMVFKFGRNSSRANHLRIELDRGRDLYNMVFIRVGPKTRLKELKKYEGVYNDQLQELFTEYTGMYTSL